MIENWSFILEVFIFGSDCFLIINGINKLEKLENGLVKLGIFLGFDSVENFMSVLVLDIEVSGMLGKVNIYKIINI